jgi:hypothetical protein
VAPIGALAWSDLVSAPTLAPERAARKTDGLKERDETRRCPRRGSRRRLRDARGSRLARLHLDRACVAGAEGPAPGQSPLVGAGAGHPDEGVDAALPGPGSMVGVPPPLATRSEPGVARIEALT